MTVTVVTVTIAAVTVVAVAAVTFGQREGNVVENATKELGFAGLQGLDSSVDLRCRGTVLTNHQHGGIDFVCQCFRIHKVTHRRRVQNHEVKDPQLLQQGIHRGTVQQLGTAAVMSDREEHKDAQLFVALHAVQKIIFVERFGQQLIQRQRSRILVIEKFVKAGITKIAIQQSNTLATHRKGSGCIAGDGGFAFVFTGAGDKKYLAAVDDGLLFHSRTDRIDLLSIGKADSGREYLQKLLLCAKTIFPGTTAAFPTYSCDDGSIQQIPCAAAGLNSLLLNHKQADDHSHRNGTGKTGSTGQTGGVDRIYRCGIHMGIANQLDHSAGSNISCDSREDLLKGTKCQHCHLGGSVGNSNDDQIAFAYLLCGDSTTEIRQFVQRSMDAIHYQAGFQHFHHYGGNFAGGGDVGTGGKGGFTGSDGIGHICLVNRFVEPACQQRNA